MIIILCIVISRVNSRIFIIDNDLVDFEVFVEEVKVLDIGFDFDGSIFVVFVIVVFLFNVFYFVGLDR